MSFMTIGKYEVDYTYQPAERMELEYPGCDESIEIHKVWVGKRNITGIISDDFIEQLEMDSMKQLKDPY